MRDRGLRLAVLLPLAALAFLLLAPDALAARPGAGPGVQSLVKSAAVVGPLGISPFFALAGFGLAASLGVWTPPAGFETFAHPAVWLTLIVLGGLLQFGRSAKLTKPVAEALGTGESLFALVATIMVMVPHFTPAPVAQAGVAVGALVLLAGLSAVIALVIVRTALDVLIWLSPFPFVDGLFQMVKLAVTVGLVLLAVLFPPAALVVNLLVVVGAIVLARWALRTARFGAAVAYDLSLGRFRDKLEMPRDPAVETDLGPFVAFALAVPGQPKRQAGRVHSDAGRWFFEVPRRFGEPARFSLGDDPDLQLTPGFLGLELSSEAGRVLLPPRYKHLAPRMLKETRLKPGERPSLLAKQSARVPRAQPSTI